MDLEKVPEKKADLTPHAQRVLKKHKLTEEEAVQYLSLAGARPGVVARAIGKSVEQTLDEHEDFFEVGPLMILVETLKSVHKAATDPEKPSVAAGMFLLKTRGGFVEEIRVKGLAPDAAEPEEDGKLEDSSESKSKLRELILRNMAKQPEESEGEDADTA